MPARGRLGATVGLALMALGAVGPWARAHTPGGVVDVSGSAHGAAFVLAACAVAIVLLFGRLAAAAACCGVAAAAWTALALYSLPGELTAQGIAWQADVAWGGYAALLGSLLLAVGAPRWRRGVALAH